MFLSANTYATSVKLILRDINAKKPPERYLLLYLSHSSTSCVVVKAGSASQPILHRDKDSLTYQPIMVFGRQGTHCNKGSETQEDISPPAFPA